MGVDCPLHFDRLMIHDRSFATDYGLRARAYPFYGSPFHADSTLAVTHGRAYGDGQYIFISTIIVAE